MNRQVSGLIKPHRNKFQVIFRLVDACIILATLWFLSELFGLDWSSKQAGWLILAILLFELFAELGDVYDFKRGMSVFHTIWKIIIAWVLVVNVLLIIQYLYPLVPTQLYVLFLYWVVIVPVELICWQIIIKKFFDYIRISGRNSRQAAIVGVNDLGREIEDAIVNDPSLGIRFCGYYDSRRPKVKQARITIDDSKFCGDYQQLIEDARNGAIDIVYITLPMKAEQRIKDIVDTLADSTLSVYFVPDLFMFDLLRSQWLSFQGIPIVSIYDTPYYGIDGLFKRMFDITVSTMILMLIAIPMLVIALAIKLDSHGPVMFKQRRYGLKGEKIIVWKFRTMKVCEDGENVPQAQKDDPRITRLGNILRRTSLDEFPQFINVLQGRMSIVGPRPHAISHNEYYRAQIKGYMLRHKVKPGITGLAQINGYRGETDTLDKMEGRIKYDLEYIRNWSLSLDVKIILLTILKGFLNPNAY